jgi:acetylornithine/succinyldiaminopimelate/putrescine aminotransferase
MNMQPSPLVGQYAQIPVPLVSGAGDQVFDDAGHAWWDFYGGHCVASTGHCHPAVVEAVREQAGALLFYSTAARVPVREAAAQALLDFAPAHVGGVFFCNSGAEANENALKLALQLTGRNSVVAFDGAFHGRTLLALSATDNPAIQAPFAGLGPGINRLPFANVPALRAADFSDVAAVIVEPVQSMAGVLTAPPVWFEELAEKARAAGALLILDEVQTGFGRLGQPFAATAYGVRPDFITCAKGIASGVPMGALLVDKAIREQLPANALGSTFGGSPLACAALQATLGVIEAERLMANARRAEGALRVGLAGSVVRKVRGAGLLLGLVAGQHAPALKKHLLHQHILVGGSADPGVLRLMPPLNLSDAAIDALLAGVKSFEPAEAVA